MTLRENLANRSRPFLDPDEQPRQIFTANTGMNPAFAVLLGATVATVVGSRLDGYPMAVVFPLLAVFFFFTFNYRVVAVTDRGIVVLGTPKLVPAKPNRVIARLPRGTVLGPASGLWTRIKLGDETMWVHPRFKRDLREADSAIGLDKPPIPPTSR